MDLASYVEREKITAAAFGRKIGCSRSFVLRLIRGERRPSLAVAEQIAKETKGAVTVADFCEAAE
jgi:transcriptional regulator with XRE-family HTH domain